MSMSRLGRTLPGLMALVAMTVSFGEAVMVSTCAPVGSMAAMHEASGVAPTEHRGPSASSEGTGERHAGDCEDCASMVEDARHDAGDPVCPWSAMVGPGCTAPVSLRSSTPAALPASAEHGCFASAVAAPPASRTADPLFHPPRP